MGSTTLKHVGQNPGSIMLKSKQWVFLRASQGMDLVFNVHEQILVRGLQVLLQEEVGRAGTLGPEKE